MSPREQLRADLLRYTTRHPHELSVAERIVRLIDDRADCASRTCEPGHLTGSAWVVSRDGQRHLLMLHAKLRKWLQPGGHADGDWALARVALREAAEETGLEGLELVADGAGFLPLDIDVHTIPARSDKRTGAVEPAHEHHDIRFLVRASGADTLRQNRESNELRWCTADEVRRLTAETSVLRLLEKAERRLAGRAERALH
ncbi:NUDIX hydrolase [Botrimarina sp.]|uniref:NUDIX hydrolase n=1 Tax=Botrimarina sp. TaxID=2795802 RepID=UPI0032EAD106